MKIALITRHAINNYGSLLQTYATQSVLEKLGHQCEIIDYIREDESYQNHEKTLLRQKENWCNNRVKQCIYLALRQPESVLSGKMFERERRKYLKLTRLYNSYDQLKANCPQADVYMTGSDQVWGPTEDGTHDLAYCLAFTADNAKRLSYAASFGRTAMLDEVKQYYKDNLVRYNGLAVREDSAVEMVNQLGLSAKQVLDPTLLLSADEWRSLIRGGKKGKYVLVYQLHNDLKLGIYAQKVAKTKGIPLIRVSTSLHQITRSGKFVWNPDIATFLFYINQAECLITDSFHGTAFAINLNKQFVEVLPNNSTGTRNQSILKLSGLTDRILTNIEDVGLALKPIDYTVVNHKIEQERNRSIHILKQMLKI